MVIRVNNLLSEPIQAELFSDDVQALINAGVDIPAFIRRAVRIETVKLKKWIKK